MLTGSFLLGIDPGLDSMGYAVLDIRKKKPTVAEMGIVKGRNKTWGDTPTAVKLVLIQAKIMELTAKYFPLHDTVYMEKGFVKFNPATKALYRARGAIETQLVHFSTVELQPSEIKKEITKHGASDKEQVAKSVAQLLGIPNEFETDDVSDALAVALAGYFREVGKL